MLKTLDALGRKLGRPKGSLGVSRLDGREDDIWKWQLKKGPPWPREKGPPLLLNTSHFWALLSLPGLSGRACQDRARSRRQGRQPREAGAERSDAP